MKKETNIKKLNINGNIVYYAKTKKYKTFTIGCTFFDDVRNEGNEEDAILTAIMSKKNAQYRDEQDFSNHLKDLYNMNYSCYKSRMGLTSIYNYVIGSINNKYIKDSIDLVDEAFKLLKIVLNEPYFDEQSLKIEKELLIADIKNIYNNKNQYANKQFLKLMFPNEKIYQAKLNDTDKVEKVELKDVENRYTELIKCPYIYYVIGDIEEEQVKNIFSSFPTPTFPSHNFEFIDKETKKFDNENVVIEELPINQSILLVGYRSEIRLTDDMYTAFFVFNSMLGQYFHSSLFQVIREEYGLVYYIGSDYNSRKGNMVVSCGIEAKNFELTLNLIKEIIQKYQNKEIDQEVLDLTKKAIISQTKINQDDMGYVYSIMLQKYSGYKVSTLEEKIKRIEEITLEDVQKAAQMLKLDTVYLLKGVKNNEKN